MDRRNFLMAGSVLSLLPSAASLLRAAPLRATLASQELSLHPLRPKSRMAVVRAPHLVSNSKPNLSYLKEALAFLLQGITERPTAIEAWRALLPQTGLIAIKMNRSGQDALGTSTAMAIALYESLLEADVDHERLLFIEGPQGIETSLQTRPFQAVFEEKPRSFGSGEDHFLRVVQDVEAIINVPFLKTHHLAGISVCLKNIAYGFIRHPARFHANACSPYISDIFALPEIREKVKVCIVDALRPVYDGGPDPRNGLVADAGLLMGSVDPVACDAVALTYINEIRQSKGLEAVVREPGALPYLRAAHEKGLGIALLQGIHVSEAEPGQSWPRN